MERVFESDPAKAAANETKHGVSFTLAQLIFLDPDRVELDANRPEDKEIRRKVVGLVKGRLLTAVYVDRNGITRLISARRANKPEERSYEALPT